MARRGCSPVNRPGKPFLLPTPSENRHGAKAYRNAWKDDRPGGCVLSRSTSLLFLSPRWEMLQNWSKVNIQQTTTIERREVSHVRSIAFLAHQMVFLGHAFPGWSSIPQLQVIFGVIPR